MNSPFAADSECELLLQQPGRLQDEFTYKSKYYEVYDQVLELFDEHRELRELHDDSMPSGNVKIIDAGGGTGLLTRHLKATDPSRSIEIFDLSPEMTGVARKNMAVAAKEYGIPASDIHISSITDLVRSNGQRVPDNSIDGVMANNVLYLLTPEEVLQLFKESARVLKVGGKLSVASMKRVPRTKMNAFLKYLKTEIEKMEADGDVPPNAADIFFSTNVRLTTNSPTTFTVEEIVKIAEQYGFRAIIKFDFKYRGTAFFASFIKVR